VAELRRAGPQDNIQERPLKFKISELSMLRGR